MSAHSQPLLRPATPSDAAHLDAFLSQFPATSMFLRGNLADHGTDEAKHPHGTTFYLATSGNAISAVFGITNGGFLMAQAPDAPQAVWAAFAQSIQGRKVVGMTGRPIQVQTCLKALGIALGPWAMLADDPLYHLHIESMVDMPAQVRPATEDDKALLETWYATYALDTGQALPDEGPSEQAKARAARAIGSDNVVILEDAGRPVAMAGLNARLPDIVQVGGVFTPDGLRGNGYARRAVAGLLRRCAQRGVTQAVLFANNAAAAQAYEALGFAHVGEYRVALLRNPTLITAPE